MDYQRPRRLGEQCPNSPQLLVGEGERIDEVERLRRGELDQTELGMIRILTDKFRVEPHLHAARQVGAAPCEGVGIGNHKFGGVVHGFCNCIFGLRLALAPRALNVNQFPKTTGSDIALRSRTTRHRRAIQYR